MQHLNRLVLVAVVCMFWAGCTSVGTGTRIVIKHPYDDYLSKYYPNLIASSPTTDLRNRMVAIPSKTDVNPAAFEDFMRKRYGTAEFEAAELSVTIRDRSTMPPFLPVDSLSKGLPDKIAAIVGNEKLSNEEKLRQEALLKARFFNIPDLIPTTTLHHMEKEKKVYFYYPRVQVDFSSRLLTDSPLDRFDFLGMVVKINNDETVVKINNDETREKYSTHEKYSVRFVDFSPKDADIVEFTRGQFTQNAQLETKGTVAIEPPQSQTKLAGELSYTQAEAYVSELKDALEKRTTSILNDGKLFVSEFRAIREKRIAGTYNFDLMLEIPAIIKKGKPPTYSSEPITNQIKVDIYLVGVIRHVYKRGMKGSFIRVPESENDKVYETVVRNVLKDRVLWTLQGNPWASEDPVQSDEITVRVVTNRDDARFLLRDESKTFLGQGSGKEATILVKNPKKDAPDRKLKITFLPIISQANNGRIMKLKAPAGEVYSIRPGESKTFTAVGTYFD